LLFFFCFQLLLLAADNLNQSETDNIADKNKQSLIDIVTGNMAYQVKISKVIQVLSNEELEESLKKLSAMDLYMWPGELLGSCVYKCMIPLDESVDQGDIDVILGNRRFLKVINELSLLPKEEAAELVTQEITSSFEEYHHLFDLYMRKNMSKFEANLSSQYKGNKPKKKLVFINSHKSGEPTLRALRYKVLALVLLAGNLELYESKSVIDKVLGTALEQRELFYDDSLFYKEDAWIMLKNASLYNRQILGIGTLRTYVDSDKSEKIINDTNIKVNFRTFVNVLRGRS
jgi:hypothetical protein